MNTRAHSHAYPPVLGNSTEHCVILDVHRPFVVFNNQALSMEPISAADLSPARASGQSDFASAAWSADCHWYFIVMDDGIALLNVFTGRGVFCRKKTAMFIDWFLKAPIR